LLSVKLLDHTASKPYEYPGVKVSGMFGLKMASTKVYFKWARQSAEFMVMAAVLGLKQKQLLDISLLVGKIGVHGHANLGSFVSIFLETNHLFLRNPRGGVENLAAMKNAGFGAVFCNIGDFAPSEWDFIRHQAAEASVVCGPWLRTATPSNNFSTEKFRYLLEVADKWNTPLIVNSESELKGSGRNLTEMMASEIGRRDAAISMEPWPFANVEWWPLGRYPFLPQIFPQDSDVAKQPEACKDQWYKYQVDCVVFTFGSYHDQSPDAFKRLTPYGIYTADDCGGNYQPWAAQGVGNPCEKSSGYIPPEVTMADIGTQHGISAFIDWLQKQPGVPTEHKPNYDPKNPGTWPWPERLERTLNMLREDHDKEN
jgi:hypothetical protein